MSPRSFRSTRPGRRSVAKVVVNTLLALIAPADLKSQAGREREKEDALKIEGLGGHQNPSAEANIALSMLDWAIGTRR
jgi:hypothetical protein